MKTLLVWLLLVLAVPAFAQTPPGAPGAKEDADAAIAKLREGLVSSFKKGDVDTLVTYLDPNVVVVWQNSEVCRGPGSVREFYQRMMGGPNPRVRSIQSEPEVIGRQSYGDWAVSWGNLHDHFILGDGSDLALNSVFTATIAKRGDRWLVTAFHVSIDAFADNNPIVVGTKYQFGLKVGLACAGAGLLLGWVFGKASGKKKPKR